MELTLRFASIDQARNAAILWLERRGAVFGSLRKIEIGRLGLLEGSEVGVTSTAGPFWRLRLDYDPAKGPHYNAEFGKGDARAKAAFLFPDSIETMTRRAKRRAPR